MHLSRRPYLYNYDPDRNTHLVDAPDGRPIELHVTGEEGGYPIFFYHGTFGSCRTLLPDESKLSELGPEGVRFIGVCRPGYGRSGSPEGASPLTTVSDATIVAEALDIVDKPKSIIGRSGGGPHALAGAARLACVRSAFVFSSPSPRGIAALDMRPHLGAFNSADVDMSLQQLHTSITDRIARVRKDPASFFAELDKDLHADDRKVIATFKPQLLAGLKDTAMHEHGGYYTDVLFNLGHKSWDFELEEITIPTLVWGGRFDPFTPINHWNFLTDNINTAHGVLDDVSHFRAHDPAMLANAIGWCLKPNFDISTLLDANAA